MQPSVFQGDIAYFPTIDRIPFEGPGSDNPLAFKAYNPGQVVGDKTMAEHLRFAACYWHTFHGTGADPFGPGTRAYVWNQHADPMDAARARLDAAFEFFTKLGVPFYCFHDRDLAPAGSSVAESEHNLQVLTDLAKARQQATGMKLLWGTANMFSDPRYMNGAATNPDLLVVSHAAAQVKAALEATVALDGENYVFWGGREGYACLLNTNTQRELEHFARFLTMARDYGRSIGFNGVFLIEPKPMEPMFHQYDFDAQTVIGFLRHHDLDRDFKLNIEANHATLAGHTFAHELQMCVDAGMLGSIDANRGNAQNGWDTDQFPTDMNDCIAAMQVVLAQGGLGRGGLNFDAKLRRESTDLDDLFIAHIGAMDAFARALVIADKLNNDSVLSKHKAARYSSFDTALGRDFAAGKLSLADLRDHAAKEGEPTAQSGKQELIENRVNDLVFGG
ncbi:xylose isomerase [Acanthopleuribacter pedis]|uniref:Xylose isomerase n=1 Tax=Acanthopleuribacter pedis TaxID=442870 RepID=A0A8J7QFK1_9BACT|nr:xylose isomerase [Acanthopleuribacter pedis]MBO1323439.1 xylose isomerase [Acanthopleuribacter pedis]